MARAEMTIVMLIVTLCHDSNLRVVGMLHTVSASAFRSNGKADVIIVEAEAPVLFRFPWPQASNRGSTPLD